MCSAKCNECGVQGGHSTKCVRFVPIQLDRIAAALERIAVSLESKQTKETGNCALCGRADAAFFQDIGGSRRFFCPIHEPRPTNNPTNGIR